MLYCDNQKDYIYSMKYYTFISPIYICRYKHMCFHTKNYLSTTRYDLSMFTRYIYQKNHIFMNIVCYAVIIQKITYIPWNIIHLPFLYICSYEYMCFHTRNYLSTIRYEYYTFVFFLYKCRYKHMCFHTKNYLSTTR